MKFIKKQKVFWQLSDGITQSLIAEFLACKQRATLGYKQGWASETTSNALTFGTLLHSCLESFYLHKAYAMEDVLNTYKKETSAERLWTPDDEQALQMNQGYLEALLPYYLKLYEKKDAGRKYLAVEEEFKNVWTGNIPLRGKIDIVYEVNGETWIMDHKTKYSFDDGTETRLSFDLQGMFYILNWKLKTGKLANGFIQNMIQRPRLRQKENESLKQFIDRVKADVDDSYFKRIQVTITKEEFDFWFEKEFKPIMDELCGWATDLLPNYRNPASCETRYGQCKFVKVCGLNQYDGLYKRKKAFMELGV